MTQLTRMLIEFKTDTSAFCSSSRKGDDFRAQLRECANSLRYIAKNVSHGVISGEVLDSNGLTIGAWRLVP